MARKRIQKQLRQLNQAIVNNELNCSGAPIDGDIFHWSGFIVGPEKTPYEGGIFFLDILFPEDYPFRPPKIIFTTKIYHPNINKDGQIGVDILMGQWSPNLIISKVLLSISSLLTDPNLYISFCPEIARLCQTNEAQYEIVARQWTKKYAQ